MREVDKKEMEEILESQIPETTSTQPETEEPEYKNEASKNIGKKLTHKIGGYQESDKEADNEYYEKHQIGRVGEKIGEKAEIRDGWMDVDMRLLGDRVIFYPEDYRFKIRPATVEAIRNWSTIDDENANSIDDVFNEVLKSCFTISTSTGPLPWGNLRSWDRFFTILLIREYTFIKGETNIEYYEDCPNCDNPVKFNLTSQSLMYEMPDPEVMKYYSREEQNWLIDPREFDVDYPEPITLYLPTLEKEANIKAWLIDRVQAGKKIDTIFVKFLPWLAPKISKDLTIAQRQIREYEVKFKSWDTDMFSFMDEVIKNISVIPSTKLISTCPTCGEEVTSPITFQDGIRSLFNVASGRKKFGKK